MFKGKNNFLAVYTKLQNHSFDFKNVVSTFEYYLWLFNTAKKEIKINALDFNLTQYKTKNGAFISEAINRCLKRNVQITVVTNKAIKCDELDNLLNLYKNFKVQYIDLSKCYGGGVLHHKFIIVDDEYLYFGSANMLESAFFNSELGIGTNNEYILEEFIKIHNMWLNFSNTKINGVKYYDAALTSERIKPNEKLMKSFVLKDDLMANVNQNNQINTFINNNKSMFNVSISPFDFKMNRMFDLDAILLFINKSRKILKICNMDFSNMNTYGGSMKIYQDQILSAIKNAIFVRKIDVEIIISKALHTYQNHFSLYAIEELKFFYNSLINNKNTCIKNFGTLKITIVEMSLSQDIVSFDKTKPEADKLPAYHCNHCKFMINDDSVMIMTSNLSPTYFVYTSGVSITIYSLWLVKVISNVFNDIKCEDCSFVI